MDDATIHARLDEADASPIRDLVQVVRLLGFRGGGMFHAYNVRVEGDAQPYVAK